MDVDSCRERQKPQQTKYEQTDGLEDINIGTLSKAALPIKILDSPSYWKEQEAALH